MRIAYFGSGRCEVAFPEGHAVVLLPGAKRLVYFAPDGRRQLLLTRCAAVRSDVRGAVLEALRERNRLAPQPALFPGNRPSLLRPVGRANWRQGGPDWQISPEAGSFWAGAGRATGYGADGSPIAQVDVRGELLRVRWLCAVPGAVRVERAGEEAALRHEHAVAVHEGPVSMAHAAWAPALRAAAGGEACGALPEADQSDAAWGDDHAVSPAAVFLCGSGAVLCVAGPGWTYWTAHGGLAVLGDGTWLRCDSGLWRHGSADGKELGAYTEAPRDEASKLIKHALEAHALAPHEAPAKLPPGERVLLETRGPAGRFVFLSRGRAVEVRAVFADRTRVELDFPEWGVPPPAPALVVVLSPDGCRMERSWRMFCELEPCRARTLERLIVQACRQLAGRPAERLDGLADLEAQRIERLLVSHGVA